MENFESQSDRDISDDENRELVRGFLLKEDAGRKDLEPPADERGIPTNITSLPCPQSHAEFIDMTKTIAITNLPIVVQRIRALYQPKLSAENKTKLAVFSAVIIDHISYLANQPSHPPFDVLESLIRHTHSLAKTYPEEIGRAFREHLKEIQEKRPLAPTSGDLIVLTAISTIFPTSDHFHQVVTPAMLSMTRYLGQKVPQTLSDLATGTYIASLAIQYQRSSKRYIPEFVNYMFTTVYAILPPKSKPPQGPCPNHYMPASLRMSSKRRQASTKDRRLRFYDTVPSIDISDESNDLLKASLLNTQLRFVIPLTQLWCSKTAFLEIVEPVIGLLEHIGLHVKSLEFSNTTKVI